MGETMNQELENAIINAKKRCNGMLIEECKGFFSKIYPFTTENISGYISNFQLKNKSLLTVGSSGDQVLNAIAEGCKDISVIDVNPYTKYYYYLKAAGIIALNKEEFFEFFRYKDYPFVFNDNKNVFRNDLYQKILPALEVLDKESFLFWNSLFTKFSGREVRRYLFQADEEQNKTITSCNLYLQSEEKYHDLKSNLETIVPTFLKGNILQYPLDKNYDNIWLSNIGSYLTEEDIQKVAETFPNHLADNGQLLISYLYETTKNTIYQNNWPSIYDFDTVSFLFEKYNPELISFLAVKGIVINNSSIQDSAILCRKRKK